MIVLYVIAVFCSAMAYDFVNALYHHFREKHKKVRASSFSSITYLVGIVGTIYVVRESTWFVIPEAIGMFTGNYLGMWWTERNENHESYKSNRS